MLLHVSRVHSFIVLRNIPLYVWMYCNLFIHLPVDGHLGVQFLAITNKTALNIHVQIFVWT